MRCFVVIYGAGAMLVLSTFKSSTHPILVQRLKGSDIHRIILMEVKLELARERYGENFERVEKILGPDQFKVLDFNGGSVFKKFSFSEMGQPLMVEF
ncbi:MAG: hypothetical protein LDL07_14560 [Desulfarculus sp.]|nr:hypothetical protein [Desulfarculus sp.]